MEEVVHASFPAKVLVQLGEKLADLLHMHFSVARRDYEMETVLGNVGYNIPVHELDVPGMISSALRERNPDRRLANCKECLGEFIRCAEDIEEMEEIFCEQILRIVRILIWE